ncbi:MAG TPA: chromosomal replication initiator DnaA [Caulobacteraceae bacterium]
MHASRPPLGRQLRLDLEHAPPAGDASFIVSASNIEAVRALEDFPGGAGRTLALIGPKGTGKSHLAADWAERVGALSLHGAEASLITLSELEGRPVLLDRAFDADDEALFHLMNLAMAAGGALLMVAREAPALWTAELPDLRSRLNAVRAVAIRPPDDTVLAGLLRRAFQTRGIAPATDLVDYLVRRIDRSPEAATAVAARLDDYSEGRPVTRALAVKMLEDVGKLFED